MGYGKRARRWLTWAFLLAVLVVIPGSSAYGGHIDTKKFNEMEDGRMAARALLEQARSEGLDIDATRSPESVLEKRMVPRGLITPEEAAFDADSLKSETPVIVMVALSRGISIRETAELLEDDIRVHKYFGYTAFIETPVPMIDSLRRKAFVQWLGLYKPEFKYEDKPFSGGAVVAYPMFGSRAANVAQLRSMGIEINYVSELAYVLVISEEQLATVAALPWIWRITLPSRYQVEGRLLEKGDIGNQQHSDAQLAPFRAPANPEAYRRSATTIRCMLKSHTVML